MENYFSPPDMYNDLTEQNINCCGTVRSNNKGMPDNVRGNTMNLKQEGIRDRTNGAMTVVIKRNKREAHMLTNIHDPP
jgi:hypothetical protein